jgi:hypothetical protein
MQYSLRWLLVAMAYVALVAGAIVSRNYFMSDAVWAVTFAVICYSIVTAVMAQGRRRAMALGFAILAAGNVACLYTAQSRLPANRLFRQLDYLVSDDSLYVRVAAETGIFSERSATMRRTRIGNGEVIVRTTNAAGTMLAGLVGCLIGALAYRHCGRDP